MDSMLSTRLQIFKRYLEEFIEKGEAALQREEIYITLSNYLDAIKRYVNEIHVYIQRAECHKEQDMIIDHTELQIRLRNFL